MGLHAGRLRHVIEIQECIQVQNASTGGMVDRWQTVTGCDAVPAEIVYISGREFISSNAKQSEIVARITIRKRPGITTKMRIIGMGKTFDIQGVLPDHETGNTWLTMPVSEVLNENPETQVIFSTVIGDTTILTDYTANLNTDNSYVLTQQEFQYLAIKQDCTMKITSLPDDSLVAFGFANLSVFDSISARISKLTSSDVIDLGNLYNNDTSSINHNFINGAEYTIVVDASVGSYGAAYLYENGDLILSHTLTQALSASPNCYYIGAGYAPTAISAELIDVRSNDIPNSTPWNRY